MKSDLIRGADAPGVVLRPDDRVVLRADDRFEGDGSAGDRLTGQAWPGLSS